MSAQNNPISVTAFDQPSPQGLSPTNENQDFNSIKLPYIKKGLESVNTPGETPRRLGGRLKNQMSKLDQLIHILKKGFRQRTERDLEQLVPLIKTIQFFQERDIKDSDYVEIVSCLTYEHFNPKDTVFEFGSVRVLIPDYHNREVLFQIEESKEEVAQLQNEIKEVQAQIDLEKKLHEEYLKKLAEEEAYFEEHDKTSYGSSAALSMKKGSSAYGQKRRNSLRRQKHLSPANSSKTNSRHQSFITPRNDLLFKLKETSLFKEKSSNVTFNGDKKSLFLKNLVDLQKSAIFSETELGSSVQDQSMSSLPKNKNLPSKEMTLDEKKAFLLTQMEELKQRIETTLYVDVVQLNTGKSFGELALTKNKPRAATIKCSSECHLAIMSKADYDKVLLRIEQKNLNKILEFLNQLPFLQGWSKVQLQKLQYAFELKHLKRNTVLYREGEHNANVYIIKNGDFEVSKKIKVSEGAEAMLELQNMATFVGPEKSHVKRQNPNEITSFKDFMHSRKTSEGEKIKPQNLNQTLTIQTQKKKIFLNDDKLQALANNKIIAATGGQQTMNNFKIAQIGVGQLLGEEDVISQRHYTTSVTCKSNFGEVYCIKNTDFIKKLKANSESWKIVLLMSMAKEKAIFDRVKKIKKLIRKNQKVSEQGFGGFGVSLLKGNLLLNKNEIDVREKFKEIINDYPFVETHKKIVEKNLGKDDLTKSPQAKRDETRKTIEIDLKNLHSRKQKLRSELPSVKNQRALKTLTSSQTRLDKSRRMSRSQSPMYLQQQSTQHYQGAAKQTYLSSKIADLIAQSVENLGDDPDRQKIYQIQKQQKGKKILQKNTAKNKSSNPDLQQQSYQQQQQSQQLNNSVIVYSNSNLKLNQDSNASLGNTKFVNSHIANTIIMNNYSKKDLIIFQPHTQAKVNFNNTKMHSPQQTNAISKHIQSRNNIQQASINNMRSQSSSSIHSIGKVNQANMTSVNTSFRHQNFQSAYPGFNFTQKYKNPLIRNTNFNINLSFQNEQDYGINMIQRPDQTNSRRELKDYTMPQGRIHQSFRSSNSPFNRVQNMSKQMMLSQKRSNKGDGAYSYMSVAHTLTNTQPLKLKKKLANNEKLQKRIQYSRMVIKNDHHESPKIYIHQRNMDQQNSNPLNSSGQQSNANTNQPTMRNQIIDSRYQINDNGEKNKIQSFIMENKKSLGIN
ncbi:UNKNOWN [Stylonychia lemnae]|uniref:Cyclic nucleotide-binding domain-containing protein n=1 Tax=Stylonychia lemnae TaxID=5949 RepID=A0A077ZU64_STYLE|nr:UNKNOWN [Stylonychia lemnae]|eukprot:CDW72825.1 UNKNOWN [Stylonychia lemnae]